jgi:hypothetical protein
MSQTATSSALGMDRTMLRQWTLPMRPVPMTAIFTFFIISASLYPGKLIVMIYSI